MNVDQLINAVTMSYKISRPVLSLSSPGIGKSSAVYKAAQAIGAELGSDLSVIELPAATANPAELSDIKFVVDGAVKDAPQEWFPTDARVSEGRFPKYGIVYMDEIADSTMTIQSALQRLLLDRKLGQLTLAKGWHTTASSNRQGDKAAAGRLSTALINRCITVNVDPDTDCFVKWALEYDIAADIIAFCRWKGSPWNFDPSSKNANPAFCSPRSMHMLSDILKFDPNPRQELISGTVGDGVGAEVAGFIALKADLPDLNAIIKDPDSVKVPTRMDVAIATLYALMSRIDDKSLVNIVKYFARNVTELATMAFKDLCTQYPQVHMNKDLQGWMSDPRNYSLLTYGFSK